jgi:3-oxoadipate enol-lactonase
MKMTRIKSSEYFINYKVNGDKQALILLHGFGLNLHIWEPVHVFLPRDIKCITIDLPGHGKSYLPHGMCSMDQMAEDVVRLMDALNIGDATIAGHSMGGYVALAFAQHYPDRLHALGLITTNASPDSLGKRENRLHEMELVQQQGSIVVAESLAPRLSKDEHMVAAMRVMITATHPQGIVSAGLGMADRPDRIGMLQNLHRLVLVVAGSEDMITPLSASEEMAYAAPSGKLLVIPGTGHLPMLETPRQLAEALSDLTLTSQCKTNGGTHE